MNFLGLAMPCRRRGSAGMETEQARCLQLGEWRRLLGIESFAKPIFTRDRNGSGASSVSSRVLFGKKHFVQLINNLFHRASPSTAISLAHSRVSPTLKTFELTEAF